MEWWRSWEEDEEEEDEMCPWGAVCAFLLDVELINVLATRHHGPMMRNMLPEPGRGGGPCLIKRTRQVTRQEPCRRIGRRRFLACSLDFFTTFSR